MARGKTDRCAPLREQIEQVQAEIGNCEAALTDPKVPASVKANCRRILPRLRRLLASLRRNLKTCEALPPRA